MIQRFGIVLTGRLSMPANRVTRFELLAVAGALVGIVLVGALSGLLARDALPLIVAPIGASAVLLFAVPASPLAQPWSIIGGNTLSAAVGVVVSILIPNVTIAAGMAVALAIAVMIVTRSLHPPGGAAALTAILVHPSSAGLPAALLFPFLPVALNSSILVAVGLLFHKATGRNYPHRAPAPQPGSQSTGQISMEDIDAALATAGDTFDIDRDDLRRLLSLAEQNAIRRSINGIQKSRK